MRIRRRAIVRIKPELVFEGHTEMISFYSLRNGHIRSSRWGYFKNKPVNELNDWEMIRLWIINGE